MALSHSPSLVMNGLVLCLDAGNRKSYPGSGTTWTDLSGNGNNGTLTNGPTYNSSNGGSLVFDGVDDYVQVTGSITTSAATFIAWINRNGNQNQWDGIIISRSTSVNASGMDIQTSNNLAYTWNVNNNTWNWLSGLVIPNLSWCMCAVSVTSSSATAYLCQSSGITSATNSVSHTSTVLGDIEIGRDSLEVSGMTRYFTGNIASAQIYNRALTASEIRQNFNALKGRFGL